MPQTSNEAAIRAAIHVAMKAAHTGANLLTKIEDDADFETLPKEAADLPYGIADLVDVNVESAGLKYDAQVFEYELFGVWTRTGLTGTIKAAQTARINEMLAQLTAANHLISIVREQEFTPLYRALFDPKEPVYSAGVSATLTVIESKI